MVFQCKWMNDQKKDWITNDNYKILEENIGGQCLSSELVEILQTQVSRHEKEIQEMKKYLAEIDEVVNGGKNKEDSS